MILWAQPVVVVFQQARPYNLVQAKYWMIQENQL